MRQVARMEKPQQVRFVVPQELADKIDRMAARMYGTRSEVLRMLVQTADETKVRPAAIGTAPVES